MLFFAATALEKIKAVPPMFWVKAAMVILGFVVAYIVLQRVLQMNKFLILTVGFVAFSIVSIVWVYERNEPAFMTPIIEPIASSGFFPTKNGTELRSLNDDGTRGPKKNTPPAPAPAKK
jgi:hypothetical protein